MEKQKIVDNLVASVKTAGLILDGVSGVDDSDVAARVHDPHPPGTKISIVVKAEEIAAHGSKIGQVIENHVKHAVHMLADRRPVELAAAARRRAEGL